MGYKLAGFNVVGGIEIDPKMMLLYRKNLKPSPRLSFLMPIQDFETFFMKDPYEELIDLDILDGSPPCSSFSMAGSREDGWQEKRKFKEGQAVQILDDLFFHFIKVAKNIKPKVVVAENVKGLLLGNAKGYVRDIFSALNNAGYDTQLFLLNSSRMGVPQSRERTFFIARRKDLNLKPLTLSFNDPPISIEESWRGLINEDIPKFLTEGTKQLKYWKLSPPGVSFQKVAWNGGWFGHRKILRYRPCTTVTSHAPEEMYHDIEPRMLSRQEILRLQTFPEDYNFLDQSPGYVCGMSVPPFMMMRVANQIFSQILSDR